MGHKLMKKACARAKQMKDSPQGELNTEKIRKNFQNFLSRATRRLQDCLDLKM